MSSKNLYQRITEIKEVGSPADKQILLTAVKQSHPTLAEQVMKWVFDKRITFGVNKKLPPLPEVPGNDDFNQFTFDTLELLCSRQLSGKAALDAVQREFNYLNAESAQLLIAVLQKNFRAGFGESMVLEVFGPIVPTFDVNLSQNYRKHGKKMPFPAWGDTKYDGIRGISFSDSDGFFSRAGLPLKAPKALERMVREFLAQVKQMCESPDDLVLDCEIVAIDGGTFYDTLGSVRKGEEEDAESASTGIRVIDLFTREEFDKGMTDEAWEVRRELLVELLDDPAFAKFRGVIEPTEGEWLDGDAAVWALFAKRLSEGHEGLIVKDPSALWENKRTYSWQKVKAEGKTEGVLIDFNYGDPQSKLAKTVGAVVVRLPSGKVTNVAGMSMKMRDHIRDNIEALRHTTIVDLEYHEMTPAGDLRHGRVKRIRDDKPVEQLNED